MITRELINRYLEMPLGSPKYTRQGLKYNCPICDEGGKYNLEVNIDRNIFNCWGCKYSGIIRKLLEDRAVDTTWNTLVEFKRKARVEDEVEEKPINYPTKTISWHLNPEVKDYLLKDRKMIGRELTERNVSYVYSPDEIYFNHICFPFYENGKLVGACLQNFSTKKYRNLSKLNFVPYKEFINLSYPITLTEGCYDCLSAVNAIPMLTTEVNKAILDFLRGRDVILGVDNTIEMEQLTHIIKELQESEVNSLSLFDLNEHEDMNDFYKNDPDGFFHEYNKCFNEILKD